MVSEFIEFLRKTNALALAVAVIMGAAIGKVVSSVVNDLLMPVIGLWLGGGDWKSWQVPLKTAPDGKVLSALGVGSFLGSLVDFVIIAFCVFLITRALLREPPAPPAPAVKACPACGESILARATRCKFCTSAV
ncbi:MAG TPA: large conductance mechanosensitive channel protein MscL [Candidatus Methylomirabilis sp.]|nr:large conductance mechanosensitive channel protein MscL [Candidatus Methylomirabilis sp.]